MFLHNYYIEKDFIMEENAPIQSAETVQSVPDKPVTPGKKSSRLGLHPKGFLLAGILIVIALAATFGVITFKHFSTGPQKAARTYIQAMLNGDVATANACSVPELHEQNKIIAQKLKTDNSDRARLIRLKQLYVIEEIHHGRVITEGDYAMIFNNQGEIICTMKKINGKWLYMAL